MQGDRVDIALVFSRTDGLFAPRRAPAESKGTVTVLRLQAVLRFESPEVEACPAVSPALRR